MQEQIETFGMLIIKGIIAPVLLTLLVWATARVPAWIKTMVTNQRAAGVLERLAQLAFHVVQEVEQTVVSQLGDKADKESLRAARDQAVATLRGHLGPRGVEELQKVFGLERHSDVDEMLVTYIESNVHDLKLGKKTAVVTPASQAGFARLSLMLVLTGVMGLILAACGAAQECKDPANAGSARCNIVNSSVDCTKDELPLVVTQFGPVVSQIIDQVTGADGSVDWNHVEGTLTSLGAIYGVCVLGSVLERYINAPPKASRPDGIVSPRLDEIRRGFEHAKTSLWHLPADTMVRMESVTL